MSIATQFGSALRIVMLDDDVDFSDAVNAALHTSDDLKLIGYTADDRELPVLLREQAPDIALIDHSLPRLSGVDVAEGVAKQFPSVMVFLLTDNPSQQLWREAVARGLRGVIRKPRMLSRALMAEWAAGELTAAVKDAIEVDRRQLSRLPEIGNAPEPTVRAADTSRIIAVWSPKGGVGKSTIAVNLACWIQGNPIRHIPAALVDLEEGAGTTHVLLGMPSRPTLLDWQDHQGDDEVDPAAVARRVAEHTSGLHCVFQPDLLQDAGEIPEPLARVVLRSLRATHGAVVVDCSPSITEAVKAAIEMAHTVLLVVEPRLPSINKAALTVQDMRAAGIDTSKIRLVINRVPQKKTIHESELTRALSFPVVGSIPDDKKVDPSTNRSTPLALSDPKGPFMGGIRRVASKVVPGIDLPTHDRRRVWPFGRRR